MPRHGKSMLKLNLHQSLGPYRRKTSRDDERKKVAKRDSTTVASCYHAQTGRFTILRSRAERNPILAVNHPGTRGAKTSGRLAGKGKTRVQRPKGKNA